MSRIKVSVYRSATEAAASRLEVIHPDQAQVVGFEPAETPRYTKGLKEIQKRNLKIARMTNRMARAVSGGVEEYLRRAEASALARKDGVIKDFSTNAARGLRIVLRRSSRVPTDVARLVPKGRLLRVLRLLARARSLR